MRRIALAATLFTASVLATAPASAQDRVLADVFITAAHFCPRGSLPADGRVLQVESNQALFSLLGTAYGGDGTTTFALPNLVGRSAIGTGRIAGSEPLRPGNVVLGMPAPEMEPDVLTLAPRRRGPENPGVYDLVEPLEYPGDHDAALEAMPDTPRPSPDGGVQLGAGLALQHCVAVQGVYPARN